MTPLSWWERLWYRCSVCGRRAVFHDAAGPVCRGHMDSALWQRIQQADDA